jgi:hypothetical protein
MPADQKSTPTAPGVMGKSLSFGRATIVAWVIALLPQGIWSALILANFKRNPRVPWAVAVMIAGLWLYWLYLGGSFAPSRTAGWRRRHMRAKLVPRGVLMWAWLAAGSSLIALMGAWMVLAQLIRMPGIVTPVVANVPTAVMLIALLAGAVISPVCEQIGIWGYAQVMLRRDFTRRGAIVLAALIFAVLPHPPFGIALLPKLVFFVLIGLTFSATAELTGSIAPNLALHALALLTFFTAIWPHDPQRALIGDTGVDVAFVTHSVQAVLFAAVGLWAFSRLNRVSTERRAMSVP